MAVFISHSFDNKPEFENIIESLAVAGIPYWNPDDVKSGASLRDQLREAVAGCGVCIFIATHLAIRSNWCAAELGAFWGSGKPVIVYLADSSLSESDLPPIVQGDVWERRISRVTQRAGELLRTAASCASSADLSGTRVGNITVDQLRKLLVSAVSLATAGKSESRLVTPEEIGQSIMSAAEGVLEEPGTPMETWHRRVLWVDDRPENNALERRALESLGIAFTLALSTREALSIVATNRFAAIISDMGRVEGPREGYVLLEAIRTRDPRTPFFIYAGSDAPEHRREAQQRGAQGSTNRARELFDMVVSVLPRR